MAVAMPLQAEGQRAVRVRYGGLSVFWSEGRGSFLGGFRGGQLAVGRWLLLGPQQLDRDLRRQRTLLLRSITQKSQSYKLAQEVVVLGTEVLLYLNIPL